MASKLTYIFLLRKERQFVSAVGRYSAAADLNFLNIKINRNHRSQGTTQCGSFRQLFSSSSLQSSDNLLTEVQEQDEVEDTIERKRNKSGLEPYHYNIVHRKSPDYTEDDLMVMPLWKYRKLYGRYGSGSKVEVKALWPSEQEMELSKEREKVEFPHSIQEMIALAKEEKQREQDEIDARQKELKENMKSLRKWKRDIQNRIEKEEREALITSERKQKQIEEVRQIFGYHIKPQDPKFEEALQKKMEEDRKKAKKEKKLLKQQRMIDRLKEDAKKEAEAEDSLYGKKIE